ncbi:MAG: hypothetical protein QOH43_850 [Solirubrobacteraceae bacterium]|jgi:hypothetical protein|nr:hypothetical protein [Solirubrobacteraceae bacterium]
MPQPSSPPPKQPVRTAPQIGTSIAITATCLARLTASSYEPVRTLRVYAARRTGQRDDRDGGGPGSRWPLVVQIRGAPTRAEPAVLRVPDLPACAVADEGEARRLPPHPESAGRRTAPPHRKGQRRPGHRQSSSPERRPYRAVVWRRPEGLVDVVERDLRRPQHLQSEKPPVEVLSGLPDVDDADAVVRAGHPVEDRPGRGVPGFMPIASKSLPTTWSYRSRMPPGTSRITAIAMVFLLRRRSTPR